MASAQLRKPEGKAKSEIADAEPRQVYYASLAPDAQSVAVQFHIRGPREVVERFFRVVNSRNLDNLAYFMEMEGGRQYVYSCRVGNQTVTDPAQIVPAIRRELGLGQ